MLVQGGLQRVAPDPDRAAELLDAAARHLNSAGRLAGDDAVGAYSLIYDSSPALRHVMHSVPSDGCDGRNASEYGTAPVNADDLSNDLSLARTLHAKASALAQNVPVFTG